MNVRCHKPGGPFKRSLSDEQIAEHGGASGVRDLAVIDSAHARPQNLLDGDKRTAWVVAEAFLNLNGYIINASDDAVVSTMQATAAGQMPEDQLAKWIRSLLQ